MMLDHKPGLAFLPYLNKNQIDLTSQENHERESISNMKAISTSNSSVQLNSIKNLSQGKI